MVLSSNRSLMLLSVSCFMFELKSGTNYNILLTLGLLKASKLPLKVLY